MINLVNILLILDAHRKCSRTRSSLNFEETTKVTLIGKLCNFPIKVTFFNILIIFQKLEKILIISIQGIKTS